MQSSRKQPSRRLEKRENSRRWLLIPALCAAVILAVVLFFVGRSVIRDRKNGGCSGCPGGCPGCGGKCSHE